jgi:hypothetical protein
MKQWEGDPYLIAGFTTSRETGARHAATQKDYIRQVKVLAIRASLRRNRLR